MQDYSIHPYCGLFPDLNPDELQDLADDIATHGQRIPIYRWNDQILDGKNRLKACKIAGVAPQIEEWHPSKPSDAIKSDDEAWSLVISLNDKRRHLATSQRALIAANRANRMVGNSANLQNTKSVDQAAAEMNVSPRIVNTAKRVSANGSQPLNDAVRNGEIKINDAANIVNLPKAAQNAAVTAVREKRAKTVTKAATREPGDETNPESDLINDLTEKLAKGSLKLLKDAEALFRAIDDKRSKCKSFAQRHKRYETWMRKVIDMITPLKDECVKLEKGWIETRKQIEE